LVIALFLIINGYSFGFEGVQHSEYRFCGYVTIFTLAPWILIFLIPAITMRFADEKNRERWNYF
jgi:ABC-2 type transport system permease protein